MTYILEVTNLYGGDSDVLPLRCVFYELNCHLWQPLKA